MQIFESVEENYCMMKKTNEQFLEEIKLSLGNSINDFEIKSEYNGYSIKIKILHKKCGREFSIKPYDFLRRKRCPFCALEEMHKNLSNIGKKNKKDKEQFAKQFESLSNNEYFLLSEYEGKDKNISILHKKCNKEYTTKPAYFLAGCRCPNCNLERVKERHIKERKSHDEFIKECKEKREDFEDYEIISEYLTKRTKITIRHLKCGRVYETRPSTFLAGHGCRYCCLSIHSKPIKIIEKILLEKNIIFQEEFKFEDCKNKEVLPFDLAIFENNKIKFLIEYDGEHHYKKIFPLKGTKEEKERRFIATQENDKIKTDYCLKNNIPLLRISYKDKSKIEEIINNFLNSTTISKESTPKQVET